MSEHQGHVLLVDDEPAFQRIAATWLAGLGYRVSVAGDAEAARAQFRAQAPDVVLLDLVMPPAMTPESGLALLGEFATVPVIVITGHAEHTLALNATERGAWDFVAKPIEPDMLRLIVGRAMQKSKLEQELRMLRARAPDDDELGIAGHSGAIRALRDMIRRVGPTRLNVIVQGPTGSGKELVARALHQLGPAPNGPFVAVHCGAVPAELLESELFGHLKGSFTGAHRDQLGLVAAAHAGTLFLDEIGEMPAAMQVKLLRFLNDGSYLPVGATEPRQAEVRVVAATHRDLAAMVVSGAFREDLFYRLKGIVLRTPALEERREDIALLATLFLKHAFGKRRFRLAGDAAAWLATRAWPGNVRELRSLIDCAAALAQAEPNMPVEITPETLALAEGSAPPAAPARRLSLDEAIATLEVQMITAALNESNDNRSGAARLLGISRLGLLKKLERLGIRR